MPRLPKWLIYILIFVLGLLGLIHYYNTILPETEKTQSNFISIIGTYLELYGIFLGLMQILELRKEAIVINTTILTTKNKINSLYSLVDISRSVKTVDEIQAYLGNDRIQMAYIRMKDLKKVLIESGIKEIVPSEDQYDFDLLNARVYSDIDDLSQLIYSKKKINISEISTNLEKLSSALTKIEFTIKNTSV